MSGEILGCHDIKADPVDGTNVLQVSKYNFFVDREEGVLAYNARTGIFALLAPDVAQALRRSDLGSRIRDEESLIEMGYLHRGDELALILSRFDSERSDKVLSLTIAPTIDCNFSCDYCFQNFYRKSRVMSPDTQKATLAFVRRLLEDGRREVECVWYGGEPLLCTDIVTEMSRQLSELIQENRSILRSCKLVTNGVLLDRVAAKALSEAGIKAAQVSFDAFVYEAGARRGVCTENGEPSPILKNIIDARDNIAIRVRINVSRKNQAEVPRIVAELTRQGFGESIYLARVDDSTSKKPVIANGEGRSIPTGSFPALPILQDPDPTLSRPEFAHFEQESFPTQVEALKKLMQKLRPRGHFCSATNGSQFLIDPSGDISRCWRSAGSHAEAMGNVHDDWDVENSEVAKRWRLYSPFRYPTCESCKVLPLCMGGCSHSRVFTESQSPPCESIKYQIQFAVETVGGALRLTPEQRAAIS